jgi:Zn-finger nucleic acid-binding protein
MDFEKFERLKKQYEEFITKAEKDIEGEKAIPQTRSVWFDRHTIEELLKQTDPKTGGLKIFFGKYDEETLSESDPQTNKKDLDGKLTVILAASDDNEDPQNEAMIVNGGKVCPPNCS